MKNRFLSFNLIVLILFVFLLLTYHNYAELRNISIGEFAKTELGILEKSSLDKLSTIKFSIYSTQTEELNQVRNDIMAQFQETDFQSLIIQPKASFIDSLLYDSKLKEYMNNSNLKKSNKSLLNKMKLYLPNELLISFLPKNESVDLILAIEEYLIENDYNFISGSNIPTVKSNIKHYYYDRILFGELMTEFSGFNQERNNLTIQAMQTNRFEIGISLLLFLFITGFIQVLDYYLLSKNTERIKFLLKGHINIRKYNKSIAWNKSLSLILILIISIIYMIRDFGVNNYFNLDHRIILFIAFTALANLLILIIKKERVDL